MTIDQKIEWIYKQVPAIECKRKCQECCGPIDMPPIERSRILRLSGQTIDFTTKLRCTALTADGLCSIHPIRPLICRLFGVVRAMQCPHGCVPERWATETDTHRWFKKLLAMMPAAADSDLEHMLKIRKAVEQTIANDWLDHLMRFER